MKRWLWLALIYSASCQATWFQTNEQQGRWAFYQQHYQQAADAFESPYRRGVALYRAGRYADAAVAFKQNQRPALKYDALYNLGNAYFQMAQYLQAIDVYEDLLKAQPQHHDGAYNLALARQLLALQQKQQQKQPPPPKKSASKSTNKQQKQDDKQDKAKQSNTTPTQQADSGDGDDKGQQTAEQQGEVNMPSPAKTTPEQQQTATEAEQSKQTAKQAKPETKSNNSSEKSPIFDPDDSLAVTHFDQQQAQKTSNASNNAPAAVTFSEPQINHWLSQVEGEPSHLLKNQFLLEEMRQRKQQHGLEQRPW